MIIDTSALVAIFRLESEAETFARLIAQIRSPRVVAPIYLEVCMVLLGKKDASQISHINDFFDRAAIEVIPFEKDMARIAVQAFLKYGKGRGHPAQLNFGDCISYAASKVEMMPLLFKGGDFRLTDVECAV
jgi:ribonuclease VapC